MPERAVVTQAVQMGVETTPGTSVAANKLLNSLTISPAMQVDMQRFRPMGQKFPSIIVPGKESVQASLTGKLSYSEIIYALCGIVANVAGVQQGGTTAYKWTFTPAARSEDTIKTYTFEQGGSVRAHKFAYGLFTGLSMAFSRDAADVSGTVLGQQLQDAITLTASPTAIEEKPVLPTHLDVWIDPTSGALGTTKQTRALSSSFAFTDRFNPLWTMNSANASFASHVEREPVARYTLLLEADAQGMALLTTMRQGTTVFIRHKCTHTDLAGTAIPYSLTIDMAAKVSAVSEFSDEDGVYAIGWTFDIVYDSTWTKAFQIDVINKQITL